MRKLTISLILLVATGATAAGAKTVDVDCSGGKSIGKALEANAGSVEIIVTGDCIENLIIDRDHVSIVGDGSATLTAADSTTPAILVSGAQNVSIVNLGISGGRRGVEIRRGAAVAMSGVTSSNNVTYGVLVVDHAAVHITNSTFNDNGVDGVGVWNGSSAVLAGTTVSDGNTRAGVLVSGSTLAALGPGSLSLQGNGYAGLYLQLTASAQIGVPVNQSGSVEGFGVYDGAFLAIGSFTASGNSFSGLTTWNNAAVESQGGSVVLNGNTHGIWAEDESSFVRIGSTTFTNNGDAAVYSEGSNLLLRQAGGTGNGAGFIARNSSVDIGQSNLTDPLDLSFGTRIEGFSNTVSSVNCDGTVISQFDHPCGSSAAAAISSAARVRPGMRMRGPRSAEGLRTIEP